jgi:dinuclear metal center YbgI/SA1388 family protein
MSTAPALVSLDALVSYLDDFMDCSGFKDYCPNGLQVEGKSPIHRIVTGVTASLDLIQAAVECKADALIVHHGYFWKSEDPRVVGIKARRLAALLEARMSLLAYHLPLDAHPLIGNNACLGQRLNWTVKGHFGPDRLGWIGQTAAPCMAWEVADQVTHLLKRPPLLIGCETRRVHTVAWCSGGAQDWFEPAIQAGADLFMSGEISEPSVHIARESGVAYLAAGHHATERYGIEALGKHLASAFGLDVRFIDIANPV